MPHRQTQPTASCNIYVASLPSTYTDEQLHALLAPFGKILSARTMCDPRSGNCKGYGFVLFENEKEAALAIQGLSGFSIEGHRIQVRFAHLAASPLANRPEDVPRATPSTEWASLPQGQPVPPAGHWQPVQSSFYSNSPSPQQQQHQQQQQQQQQPQVQYLAPMTMPNPPVQPQQFYFPSPGSNNGPAMSPQFLILPTNSQQNQTFFVVPGPPEYFINTVQPANAVNHGASVDGAATQLPLGAIHMY